MPDIDEAPEPITFRSPPPPDPDEPKRGRGRPRKDTKKRAAPKRLPPLEKRIGAFIVQTNMILLQLPWTKADALDAAEIQLLTQGISDECSRHPLFRGYVETMLSVSASGGLALTVVIIAGRRAARHNLIPEGTLPMPNETIDAMLGAVAEMATQTDPDAAAATLSAMQSQGPAMMPDEAANGRE